MCFDVGKCVIRRPMCVYVMFGISTARRMKSLECFFTPCRREVSILMMNLDISFVVEEVDIMSLKSSVNSGISKAKRFP